MERTSKKAGVNNMFRSDLQTKDHFVKKDLIILIIFLHFFKPNHANCKLKTENDDFEKLSYKYVHRPTKYEAFANKMIPMNYTIF